MNRQQLSPDADTDRNTNINHARQMLGHYTVRSNGTEQWRRSPFVPSLTCLLIFTLEVTASSLLGQRDCSARNDRISYPIFVISCRNYSWIRLFVRIMYHFVCYFYNNCSFD